MDEARARAIYATLEQARVPLTPDLSGPGILMEKLREVRRWQDTVISLSAEILRASAGAKKAVRAQQAVVSLTSSPDRKRAQEHLGELKDALDDLRALEQATRVCLANLKTTESDIRLSAHLLDLQIKLGEVQPPRAAPTPPPPSPHAAHQPVTIIEGLFNPAAIPTAPVTTAAERGPLPTHQPAYSGVVETSIDDLDSILVGLTPQT